MVQYYKSNSLSELIHSTVILTCWYGKKDWMSTKRFSTSYYYTVLKKKKSFHGVTNCPILPETVLVSAQKVLYHRKLLSSRLFLKLPSANLSKTNPFWHHKIYCQNVLKAPLIHNVNGFFQKCMIPNMHSS